MTSGFTIYEADLHCHTTASDGILTPRELICLAADLGIKGVGITDHDTIQGWKEAEEAGAYYKIEVLRGVELNTDWKGTEVHILGYELDNSSSKLIEKLRVLREAREFRMLEIIKRLAAQGINLCADEVRKLAKGESIGRPHIAQSLVEGKYVPDIREAFKRYLGQGAPAYVPRYKITTEEGIELIREAHGIPVLAHPGMQKLDEDIALWVEMGLQGIEVIHSEHKENDVIRYTGIAQQHDLLMTGGSDFHGEARKPGVKLGGWGVPLKILQQIKEAAILKRNCYARTCT